MSNPIDRPDFNRSKYREPNPDLMARARGQASVWRSAVEVSNDERAKLDGIIIELFKTGHSFRQIREATRLSIQVIQMVVAKSRIKGENP